MIAPHQEIGDLEQSLRMREGRLDNSLLRLSGQLFDLRLGGLNTNKERVSDLLLFDIALYRLPQLLFVAH